MGTQILTVLIFASNVQNIDFVR